METAALLLGGVLAAIVAVAVLWRRRAKRRRLARHYPSWVAGLEYESPQGVDRAAYCARLKLYDFIRLVREPDNPHDDGAVAVWHGKVHIGYIPRKHAWIGEAMDEGHLMGAVVRAIERDEDGRISFVGLEVGIAEET